jgi:type I restriction enzyme S subunit
MTMPEQKKAVVPRLRFPEFRDAGPWEVKRLGDVAEVNAAGDLDFSQFSPVLTQEHIYPIYSNSIAQEGLYGFSTYPKYKKNSVTITARGTLGVAFYRDHDFVGIGRLLIVNARQEISPRYLKEVWNYLVREPFENGGIPQLTAIKARTIKLVFPSLPEQQKIADCLSSLDELIELQTKQLEALQTHKKGLMQQLFPREGETTPRLRFPEFRDAGPWENIQVSDFGTIVTGKTPSTSNPKYWNGRFAWVTPTDISDTKYIYTTDRLLTSEGVQLIGVLPENTVLITCIASIGKNAILKVPGSCNQQINAIIPNSNFNSDFIYYLFCKNQTILQNQAGTSATAIIPKSAFEKFYFHVPKLPEQQKIADCLSSLDELIELQAKQLEALQAHKKGLMQQLFPQEIDL